MFSVEKQMHEMSVQGYVYQKNNTGHVEEVGYFIIVSYVSIQIIIK